MAMLFVTRRVTELNFQRIMEELFDEKLVYLINKPTYKQISNKQMYKNTCLVHSVMSDIFMFMFIVIGVCSVMFVHLCLVMFVSLIPYVLLVNRHKRIRACSYS
ncbi:hypothetical protein Hanom_Chr05g00452751 [Helianthus anomalus]